MKPKYLLPYIFVILSISISYAQEPLLLETLGQAFNHQTQEWEDEYKTIYSYDQNGKMIWESRKRLNICDIKNDRDCDYNSNPTRVFYNKSWRYNDQNQITFYSEEELGYFRDTDDNWNFQSVLKKTIETKYNEDTLVLETIERTEEPYYQGGYSTINTVKKTNRYDENRMPLFLEEIYENKTISDDLIEESSEGNIYRSIYQYYNGLKMKYIREDITYYNEDTTFYIFNQTDYHYNDLNLLEYEIMTYLDPDLGPNQLGSKITYTYNANNLPVRIDEYLWNRDTGDWELNGYSNIEYHNNGNEKYEMRRFRYYGENRITTSTYDEQGRQIKSKSELYDDDWNFIKELNRSMTVYYEDDNYRTYNFNEDRGTSYMFNKTYNNEQQPLEKLFQSWTYTPDSVLEEVSINKQVYAYDESGYLIEKQSFRHIYDGDSILSTSCCGFLYDLYETYENRCDGAPLVITSEQWNYVYGANWELYPEPILRRNLNSFSRSICDLNEPEVSLINAYPNPTTSVVNIQSEMLKVYGTKLDLIDLAGNTLISETAPITNTFKMDLSTTAPGIYIIKLTNELGSAEQKIVYYR